MQQERLGMAAIVSQIVDVCVFRRNSQSTEYLLLQRSHDEDLYPNLWQILTGTIADKETALMTALRELKEETSLSIKRMWTVPYIDAFYTLPQDAVHLSPVFAVEVVADAVVKLSDEHQNFIWMNLAGAKKKLAWPGQRKVLQVVQEYIVEESEAGRLMELSINAEGK
jgi:dATP pyrophosphohydrolase